LRYASPRNFVIHGQTLKRESDQVSRTRAIRLSPEEEMQIEEFLKRNPFLDFSKVARMAILSFIKAPTLQISPIVQLPQKKKSKGESKHV